MTQLHLERGSSSQGLPDMLSACLAWDHKGLLYYEKTITLHAEDIKTFHREVLFSSRLNYARARK